MSLIALFVGAINLIFLEPILSLALEEKGMKEFSTGLGFAVVAFTYAFGAPVVGLICKVADRKLVIFFSFLILSLALLLIGPCQLLHTEKLWVTFVGLAL
jgi:MFS family permease